MLNISKLEGSRCIGTRTLSIISLTVTFNVKDTQHSSKNLSVAFIFCFAECRNADFCNAECRQIMTLDTMTLIIIILSITPSMMTLSMMIHSITVKNVKNV